MVAYMCQLVYLKYFTHSFVSTLPLSSTTEGLVRGDANVMENTYFGIFLIVVLLGSDPPANQVVTHCIGKSKVVIPLRCHISVLDQCEVQMPVEVCLQVCNILNTGQASR